MLLVSDLTRVVEERGGKTVAAVVAAQRSSKGHLNLNKHLPRQMGASPGWGTWLHLSTTRPPLSPAPHNSQITPQQKPLSNCINQLQLTRPQPT